MVVECSHVDRTLWLTGKRITNKYQCKSRENATIMILILEKSTVSDDVIFREA